MNVGNLCKITSKIFFESILTNGINYLAVSKDGLFLINCFKIKRNQAGHPAAAMNDVGRPAKFLDGLKSSFAKKYGTQTVVIIPLFILIMKNVFAFEEIFVI